MKCGTCNHFITNLDKGCWWCGLPPDAREEVSTLDLAINELQRVDPAKFKDDIEKMAALRIDIIQEAQHYGRGV